MTIHKKINYLRHHSGFRRYANNTSWLMGEKILRMFVGLFVGVWIARYLGPGQFGLLNYVQSFVFLFTVIATLGLDSIVIRELVKNDSKRDVILGSAFVLKLIGAVLILPILLLAIQLTDNDAYTNLLVFLIASATIFQSFNVIDFFYQSRVESKYIAIANGVGLALSSLIKIALILYEAPLIAFVIVIIFDSIVLAVGLLYCYKKVSGLRVLNWRFDGDVAKYLLRDCWPLIVSGLVISIYMKIDQIMIMEIMSAEAVGLYAAATKLSESWYFIPTIIISSLFPAIINAKKINPETYLLRLSRLYKLMIWGGGGIAILISITAEDLVTLLYGVDYESAVSVLVIHIWAGIFVSIGLVASKWFLIENIQRLLMFNTFIGAIFNIILNLIFIPKFGIVGAAYATLVSQVFAAYFADLIYPKTRSMFWLKTKAMVPFYEFKKYEN